MEILELKSITGEKKSVEGLNSIFDLREKIINELGDRLMQVLYSEGHRRERRGRKISRASEECGTPLMHQNTHNESTRRKQPESHKHIHRNNS